MKVRVPIRKRISKVLNKMLGRRKFPRQSPSKRVLVPIPSTSPLSSPSRSAPASSSDTAITKRSVRSSPKSDLSSPLSPLSNSPASVHWGDSAKFGDLVKSGGKVTTASSTDASKLTEFPSLKSKQPLGWIQNIFVQQNQRSFSDKTQAFFASGARPMPIAHHRRSHSTPTLSANRDALNASSSSRGSILTEINDERNSSRSVAPAVDESSEDDESDLKDWHFTSKTRHEQDSDSNIPDDYSSVAQYSESSRRFTELDSKFNSMTFPLSTTSSLYTLTRTTASRNFSSPPAMESSSAHQKSTIDIPPPFTKVGLFLTIESTDTVEKSLEKYTVYIIYVAFLRNHLEGFRNEGVGAVQIKKRYREIRKFYSNLVRQLIFFLIFSCL